MFRTIGHTFELMKMSWGVLMKDRELILFPILSGVSLLVLIGVFLAIASGTGTLDRLDALQGDTSEEEVGAVDAVLGLGFVFLSSAIVIFFNARTDRGRARPAARRGPERVVRAARRVGAPAAESSPGR